MRAYHESRLRTMSKIPDIVMTIEYDTTLDSSILEATFRIYKLIRTVATPIKMRRTRIGQVFIGLSRGKME